MRSIALVSLGLAGLTNVSGQKWTEVADRVLPAVVVIETEKAQGSGFFVRSDGTLITNQHVVSGASQIAVRTKSGEVYRGGFVMASDETRDLAVIRVDAFGVSTVSLGNSADLRVGTPVLLLGAPRGLEQSASDGIVAGLRTNDSGVPLIQTSAAASPGSSGGPLVNDKGEVVGILTFTLTRSQNLNFALPINAARGMLDRLAAVAAQPERRLAALAPAGAASTPSTTASSKPPAAQSGGVFVTGYGPKEHLQGVYLELTGVLAEGSIRVVELREVELGGGLTSISGVIEAAKNAGAAGLLYFSLSTGWGQTDRLRLQCFDATGKLLWQEETTSLWQNSVQGAVNAVTKRMKDKLRSRIQRQQVPSR